MKVTRRGRALEYLQGRGTGRSSSPLLSLSSSFSSNLDELLLVPQVLRSPNKDEGGCTLGSSVITASVDSYSSCCGVFSSWIQQPLLPPSSRNNNTEDNNPSSILLLLLSYWTLMIMMLRRRPSSSSSWWLCRTQKKLDVFVPLLSPRTKQQQLQQQQQQPLMVVQNIPRGGGGGGDPNNTPSSSSSLLLWSGGIYEDDINELVKSCLEDPDINIPAIPDWIEHQVYKSTITLVLTALHKALNGLHGKKLWDHYELQLSRLPRRKDKLQSALFNLKQHTTSSEHSLILNQVADRLVANKHINQPLIPDIVEKQLYVNCLKIIFRVLDLLAVTARITLCGHELKLQLDPCTSSEDYEALQTATLNRVASSTSSTSCLTDLSMEQMKQVAREMPMGSNGQPFWQKWTSPANNELMAQLHATVYCLVLGIIDDLLEHTELQLLSDRIEFDLVPATTTSTTTIGSTGTTTSEGAEVGEWSSLNDDDDEDEGNDSTHLLDLPPPPLPSDNNNNNNHHFNPTRKDVVLVLVGVAAGFSARMIFEEQHRVVLAGVLSFFSTQCSNLLQKFNSVVPSIKSVMTRRRREKSSTTTTTASGANTTTTSPPGTTSSIGRLVDAAKESSRFATSIRSSSSSSSSMDYLHVMTMTKQHCSPSHHHQHRGFW